MDNTTHAINWFEIPTEDIERAQKFYEDILDIKMSPWDMDDMKMVIFPGDSAGGMISGALIKMEGTKPSMEGTMVYLNANPSIDTVTDRIEGAGGKVLLPRTLIAEGMGYMAVFSDTEGNRVGLHSMDQL